MTDTKPPRYNGICTKCNRGNNCECGQPRTCDVSGAELPSTVKGMDKLLINSEAREWWICQTNGYDGDAYDTDPATWIPPKVMPYDIRRFKYHVIEKSAYDQAKSDDAKTQLAFDYLRGLFDELRVERDAERARAEKCREALHACIDDCPCQDQDNECYVTGRCNACTLAREALTNGD